MITRRIEESGSLDESITAFLDDIAVWVHECMDELADEPATDVHDQGTFTTAWEPYIVARDDAAAVEFMSEMRDKVKKHFDDTGRWKHGYWRMQEAHHGTEHYELFLGTLWRLRPDDQTTIDQMLDAAEHIGNWVEEIPAWFDWENGVFLSMYFGTDGVRTAPDLAFNVPDHIRCANICLIAYQMANDRKYLDLTRTHCARWVRGILDGDQLPVALDRERAIYSMGNDTRRRYKSFAGQSPELSLAVDRAENFLASGAINTFLIVWKITGDLKFRDAAEKLISVISTQLGDPDAGPVSDIVRFYRNVTGDRRYDDLVLSALGGLDPFSFSEISVKPWIRRDRRPSGIGKRADMPVWFEDGEPRRINPITLSLLAEIREDERLAVRAVDIARTYFLLAREIYPSGRDHGCSAQTVSAVARGHGRNNGAGVITSVLKPIMGAFSPT